MTWLRNQIVILLVAVLVLTGHSMAIARGMQTTTGMMELCTGTGPVMVQTDVDGNPTGSSHICPEFSLSLMDAIANAPVAAVPLEVRAQRVIQSFEVGFDLIRGIDASARAPPVLA